MEQKVYMVGPVPNKYLNVVNEAQQACESTITTFLTSEFQACQPKQSDHSIEDANDDNDYCVEDSDEEPSPMPS